MAKFLHSDLGHRSAGDVLVVTLTSGANVLLLDETNYQRYRRGEKHQYRGGLAKKTPVRLRIPHAGHWHGVVDMRGLRGSTNAGFQVINGSALQPLPPIRDHRSEIQQIADNLVDSAPSHSPESREFDVFISHASEDKDEIVRPLAHALRERGLEVWYDEFVLKVGDSLRRRIDEGISRSRFGLVILSRSFFAKDWPQHELDGLVTMSVDGRQVLLPIWHQITKDEVITASPTLADKVALRTADYGIHEIADEITAVVSEKSTTGPVR
ncbi:MAG: DUF1883 domain-containing protein [Acidimicrobiaceae bacterium]|nr:DUF1883 domain-containing protein [Acidimicrobiaceae bacterium]